MTPFTFRAKFTGICATVPNKSDLTKSTKACVVMPGVELQEEEPRKASLDGVGPLLCPHQAFVWFNLGNLGNEADWQAKLPLNDRRLTFAIEEAESGLNDFSIVTAGDQNIRQLLQLEFAAPDHCLLDPACVADLPPSIVHSQAVITRGKLGSELATNPWRFPGTLGGKPVQRFCSRYTVLELQQLTKLTLVAMSFDGKQREAIHLSPAPGRSTVEVTISNSCIDYPDPPSWIVEKKYPALPDVDFRWYYELLPEASRLAIKTLLDGLPLPYPYPVPGTHFIHHGNCWPMLAFAGPPPKS